MKQVIIGLFGVFIGLFWGLNIDAMGNEQMIKTVEKEPLNEQMMMDLLKIDTEDVRQDEDIYITYQEAQILKRIAMAEAGTEGIEGKAMVMQVVLNRVADERFPNTIKEVVFQKYQFSTIANGSYYEVEPDIECNLALADVEQRKYENIDALYFENAKSSWQERACEFVCKVGNHRFYKN
jgi:N-acetylmuramoyl-L-alanine amidase